ncbi:MAG TPA: SDR family oxidoreductase [Polyangiales bacterium]|nr:SDR family oxidoreductase [Polyangiales bacterium]
MATFITGSTGYIGSYVVAGLLREYRDRLTLLVRAKDTADARQRLWKSLQLHMGFAEFREHVGSRVDIVLGDITDPRLGLSAAAFDKLAAKTDSIIHIAASLNRKSAKACLNVNLRGSLEVLKLARAAQSSHGLRRFSDVSTTAVAGTRAGETVLEDSAIDWARSDYDPYARTKKFAEHMLHELLPDVSCAVFRPSIVLGDSRFAETTQFDMVRAFVMLARLPVLPFDPSWRLDIVPADYVGRGIVAVHQRERIEHGCYHLSSGRDSLTYRQIVGSLRLHGKAMRHVFVPRLNGPFARTVSSAADTPRPWGIAPAASLLKVFLPYLCFDTVFDNARIVSVLGEKPAPFSAYASRLLDFAVDQRLSYPYKPWPETETSQWQSAPDALSA